MKSMEELAAIRKETLERISLRKENNSNTRVVIGMATCGIAAGARPVMHEFLRELKRRGLTQATVTQTGCVGMCRYEPLVDVYTPQHGKVTYVNVKPEMVGRIIAEHIVNNRPVTEFTIGAVEGLVKEKNKKKVD